MGGLSVIGELASIGYDAEWRVVSAASVGANHRRDRIIIVAYPTSKRLETTRSELQAARTTRNGQDERQFVADPNGGHSSNGRQRQVISSEDKSRRDDRGGSGSNTREVGVGSTRQSERDLADTSSFGQSLPTKREQSIITQSSSDGGERRIGDVADTASEFCDVRGHRKHSDENGQWRNIQSETGASSRNVANADAWETSWRLRSISEDSGLVFGGDNLRRGAEGYAGWQWWEVEPDVGRVVNGVPSRVDRLKGLGNAVVPQVAEVIGRLIVEADA